MKADYVEAWSPMMASTFSRKCLLRRDEISPVFHGQVLETTTEDLTRKRKPQKEIPVFWLKILVCCAVSTTGPTQANALLGAEKLVYGFQETVIP